MLANNIATANSRESNIASLARTCDSITTAVAHILEVNATTLSCRFTQHQRSARGCIHFHVVMRLDHFNVEVLIQRRRYLFRQLRQ